MSADTYPRIYAVVRRIPRGRVATYGQVAALAGLPHAPRVVGYALHALKDGTPVPWHRVVAAGGKLSLGKLSPHGAITQRLRLEKEGVRFDGRGCADMERCRWSAGLGDVPRTRRARPVRAHGAGPGGSRAVRTGEGGIVARVTGIGGVFLKARDPKALAAWYRERLGIDVQDWNGAVFTLADTAGPRDSAYAVWAAFPADTDYFGPGPQSVMVNFRVDDLDGLLAALLKAGCAVDAKRQDGEQGRFGWVTDPEGNRIELWQPPA